MHISKIIINGRNRACINNSGFSNAEEFIYVTLRNELFDSSLGGEVNDSIIELIDRALRSGAESLQMAGSDMLAKTTFAIYKQNINLPILTAMKQLGALFTSVDNLSSIDIRELKTAQLDNTEKVFNRDYTQQLSKITDWQGVLDSDSLLVGSTLTAELAKDDWQKYTYQQLESQTVAELDSLISQIETVTGDDIVVSAPYLKADKVNALNEYINGAEEI